LRSHEVKISAAFPEKQAYSPEISMPNTSARIRQRTARTKLHPTHQPTALARFNAICSMRYATIMLPLEDEVARNK
jgi:hypothetical protein